MMTLVFLLSLISNSHAQNAFEPQIDDFDKIILYTTSEYQYFLKRIYDKLGITEDSDLETQITYVDSERPACKFALKVSLQREIKDNEMLEIVRFTNCAGKLTTMYLRRTGPDLQPSALQDLILFKLPKVKGTQSYYLRFNLLGLRIYHYSSDDDRGKFEFQFPKYNWWIEYNKQVGSSGSQNVSYTVYYKLPDRDLQSDDVLTAEIRNVDESEKFRFYSNEQRIRYFDFLTDFQTLIKNMAYDDYKEDLQEFILD